MYSFKIEIAQKKIVVECFSGYLFKFVFFFLSSFSEPDCTITVKKSEIEREIRNSPFYEYIYDCYSDGIATEVVDLEFSILLRKVANYMISQGILLIHGAAIEVDEKCYIFIAPSGTGKTTHIMNWIRTIPGTIIINGDKPLVDVNSHTAFGTPWCGKEKLSTNKASQIAGIIVLERGKDNYIESVAFREVLPALLKQVYIPNDRASTIRCYQHLSLLKDIPWYRLKCNTEQESAIVAYNGLKS